MNDSKYTAALEIILPSGSTSTDLQEAIDNAASGDTIVISGDMPFTDVVTLPTGKEITIQSSEGSNRVMSQHTTNIRHFSIAGILILKDVTLDGMHSVTTNGGGGINANGGSLYMNEGVVIRNCYTSVSGGAINMANGDINMSGSTIISNAANNDGGGISLSNSDFTISGGIISDNIANNDGGGIFLSNSTFVMNGGIISKNAANSGGGFYISSSSLLVIYEGIISDNTASYGGGIYITDANLDIDAGVINGNTAAYGGGIYTRLSSFENVNTSVNTVFSCNRANNAHQPPADAETRYPNIQFARTTITNHPLNNYDINYMVSAIIDAAFHVSYNSNGGIGSHTGPGIEPCDSDTALPVEDTGISRYGYTFLCWNTMPDASGDSYVPEAEIIISRDITLYAQWEPNIYTVTYNANGGTGDYEDNAAYDTIYTVLSLKETGISRMMHILTSWNTRPDGTGTSYAKGDTFIINGKATLYAQWKEITRNDAINLLLTSIAIEEFAVAHILNTEGQQLQYVLGTPGEKKTGEISVCDIIEINNSVQKTLRNMIKTEMLLQIKMEYLTKLDKDEDE